MEILHLSVSPDSGPGQEYTVEEAVEELAHSRLGNQTTMMHQLLFLRYPLPNDGTASQHQAEPGE